MNSTSASAIGSFRDSRARVGIRREKIDPNTLYGVIADFDAGWLLVRQIFDFIPDGWVLLRRCDVSEIRSGATDAFQKRLMEEEGSWAAIDFSARIPEGGVPELLARFPRDHVIILEGGTGGGDGSFHIGLMKHADEEEVHLHTFGGDGHLEPGGFIIPLRDVTSISYDTSYTLHYQRYFQRNAGR